MYFFTKSKYLQNKHKSFKQKLKMTTIKYNRQNINEFISSLSEDITEDVIVSMLQAL
jgi:hypothetical protein